MLYKENPAIATSSNHKLTEEKFRKGLRADFMAEKYIAYYCDRIKNIC